MHDQCKGDQCMFAFSYKTTKIQHFPPPLVVSTLQHFVSSLPTTQGSRSLAHKPPQIPGSGFWVLCRWRAWFTSITCQLKVIYAAYIAWKSEVQTFPINDINARNYQIFVGKCFVRLYEPAQLIVRSSLIEHAANAGAKTATNILNNLIIFFLRIMTN